MKDKQKWHMKLLQWHVSHVVNSSLPSHESSLDSPPSLPHEELCEAVQIIAAHTL